MDTITNECDSAFFPLMTLDTDIGMDSKQTYRVQNQPLRHTICKIPLQKPLASNAS